MRKAKFFLAVLLVLHAILLVNLKFTAWPEMIFWPYLILKGWLPYRDIAIAHTPGLLAELTIFYKIFGLGLIQLKVYTWVLILGSDLILFWVARKLWNFRTALLALLIYVPLQLFYEGNGLWFDLALVPLALIIFYHLEKKNYLWAGIFWAVAFLTKQTAFWLLIPIIFTILRQPLKEAPFKGLRKIVIGIVAVGGVTFLALQILGIWGDFWLWAIKFGITKLPASSGQIHLPSVRQFVVALFPFLLLVLFSFKLKKSYKLLVWVASASLGVIPRWELFHFQPALPFLALGFSHVIGQFPKLKIGKRLILSIGLLIVAALVSQQIFRNWRKGNRFFEPEVIKISDYIKVNVDRGDEIYIINAWDNLYVLSDTIPATRPWLPHLSWYMEIPEIQDMIVSDLQLKPPKLIVQGEYKDSGLGAYKPEKINDYIMENYTQKDKINGYLIWGPK